VKVLIFGAGGLGREVLNVFRASAAAGRDIVCHGFIVDPEFATAPTLHDMPIAGGVEVAEGAELGTGAKVIPRLTVGAWSVVGAGATVIRPVAANSTVAGVPARQIGVRSPGWHDRQ